MPQIELNPVMRDALESAILALHNTARDLDRIGAHNLRRETLAQAELIRAALDEPA